MTIHLQDPFAPFEEKIRNFLFRHHLIATADKHPRFSEWIIALSGGGDSVFLCHLLKRLCPQSVSLTLAHFNHHTNLKKNRDDAAFADDLARSLNLSITFGESPSKKLTRPGLSETALRKERHDFFDELLLMKNDAGLFLAHQRDDRIETILANLFRGGGPRSLIGMTQESRGRIFRPLLDIGRVEIRQALDLSGLPYRNDPENLNPAHLRNRVRLELRREIDRFFPPNGTNHLAHFASLMERELESSLPASGLLCEKEVSGQIRFSLFLYQNLRPSAQGAFLRKILNRQAELGLPIPPERNLLLTLENADSQKDLREYPLGNGWVISIVFGRTDLVYKYPETDKWRYELNDETWSGLGYPPIVLPRGGSLRLHRTDTPESREKTMEKAGMSVFLGLHGTFHPEDSFSIRYWSPGLCIYPGSNISCIKTVAACWKDRPLSLARKHTLPVLCRGPYAIWIPGILDRTCHLPDNGSGETIRITFQERERSEWKKFLENP